MDGKEFFTAFTTMIGFVTAVILLIVAIISLVAALM